jgi:hypothetical protein
MTVSQIKAKKERFDEEIYACALALVENRARKILRSHSNLDEFVMGMGGWLFSRHGSGDSISDIELSHIPAYVLSFKKMMDEFSDMDLRVTGEPMRFTADGPVVRMWGVCDGLDGVGVAAVYAPPVPEKGTAI